MRSTDDLSVARFANISPRGALALAGAVLTTIAYSFLPVTSDVLFGSRGAPDVASELVTQRSLLGLRFMPVALLVMVGGAVWLLLRRWATRWRFGVAVAVLAASGCAVIAYLAPYTLLDSNLGDAEVTESGITASTFTGPGFWLVLLGAALTAFGAAWELARTRRSARRLRSVKPSR
jgi:hypothetical protein